MTSPAHKKASLRQKLPTLSIAMTAAVCASGLTYWAVAPRRAAEVAARTEDAEANAASNQTGPTVVVLTPDKWTSAGIVVQPLQRSRFQRSVEVTGKVSLNEDHVAHLYPMVSGRVDEVRVQFGQHVQRGDTLVVIQSKEIGQAKLELYQNRLLNEFADVRNKWMQDVAANTHDLIASLKQGLPVDQIDEMFRNRPMGEYREKLLSAYVSSYKSRVDYERLAELSKDGIAPAKQLMAAEAQRNADRATFQAWLEQVSQQSEHAALLAQQAQKEAATKVAVDETNLKILGYSDEQLAQIDPVREGEAVSHYPIAAPFDGTVISKDVVLQEQVGTDRQILSVADLSTVWIVADIYEQHLPLLKQLAAQDLTVRSDVWPDRSFSAAIFYTGDLIDEATRTLSLRAVADNSSGDLKPGMFVRVELPEIDEPNVLAVPREAIQEHEGQAFAFVQVGTDQFERRELTLGRKNATVVEILTGLKEGDQLVTKGGFALKSQMLADLME